MIVEKRKVGGRTLLNGEGVIKRGESAQFFAQALGRQQTRPHPNVHIAAFCQVVNPLAWQLVGH